MTMPSVPSVFMGDELGLTGTNGEHSRTPFPWTHRDTWDHDTLTAYQQWITLRHRNIALRHGGLRWVHAGSDNITYLREHPQQRLLIHISRATHTPVTVHVSQLMVERAKQVRAVAGEPPQHLNHNTIQLPATGPGAHVYLIEQEPSAAHGS